MFQLDDRLKNDTLLVAHFELNDVLLMNDANYPWLILVPRGEGVTELHQLTEDQLGLFWKESHFVARHLETHFQAHKINIAALGNVVPQLHVHHIVRFHSDAAWPKPVWGCVPAKAYEPDELEITLNSLKALLSGKSIAI